MINAIHVISITGCGVAVLRTAPSGSLSVFKCKRTLQIWCESLKIESSHGRHPGNRDRKLEPGHKILRGLTRFRARWTQPRGFSAAWVSGRRQPLTEAPKALVFPRIARWGCGFGIATGCERDLHRNVRSSSLSATP